MDNNILFQLIVIYIKLFINDKINYRECALAQ